MVSQIAAAAPLNPVSVMSPYPINAIAVLTVSMSVFPLNRLFVCCPIGHKHGAFSFALSLLV